MSADEPQGIVLTCTGDGMIDAVIADNDAIGVARHLGESFVRLVDAASISKALNFLLELKAGRTVTGWEMNLVVGRNLHTLQFAGFHRDHTLYIIGAKQDSEVIRMYEDLSRMNNEQITSLRRVVKERASATPAIKRADNPYLDDLTKLNNDLVTLQRELSQKNRDLERLNAEKNQLLGAVAHDLRNPLSVILDYSDFLLAAASDRLQPDEHEYLHEIHNSSRFMLAMVGDLLNLSAVEAGRLNLDRRTVELEVLVQRVLKLLRPQAERKGMTLTLEYTQPAPKVWADEFKTQQVVTNLVSNAIKYSPAGAPTQVRLFQAGEMAVVEVVDHGQGIPAAEVANLFKPYSRTSVQTTGGESSTGLGLAICRRIVEGHGGEISVTSTVGQGATFRFTLPLAEVLAPPVQAPVTPVAEAVTPSIPTGLRLLLVEDSPINSRIMTQMWAKLGCEVDTVENGAAAIEAVKQLPYDFVFLDFHLPDMTAPEIALRLASAAVGRPRLFTLTGGISAEETAACLASGIEAVLLKPLSRDEARRILMSAPAAVGG
jgi:two-component system OmpR family sensor kinase